MSHGDTATDPVDAPGARRVGGGRTGLGAWTELLRLPALFTVPGDALAGAAAVPATPGRRTALAIGSSLCLYEAGMALNDWADRDEDALEALTAPCPPDVSPPPPPSPPPVPSPRQASPWPAAPAVPRSGSRSRSRPPYGRTTWA